MRLPDIPSLSSAALPTARCCKHCCERSPFLSPWAAPLSLLPHRTPKLSRRGMMCSRHQHESKPSHDSGPLPQADVAGENSAKSQLPFGLAILAHFTMVKQEEKLSVTRSLSVKQLSLFNKMSLVFIFHTTESCIGIQIDWNSRRKVGQIKKSLFYSKLFFLDTHCVTLYWYHCNCIHERGNSNFIVNLKLFHEGLVKWVF